MSPEETKSFLQAMTVICPQHRGKSYVTDEWWTSLQTYVERHHAQKEPAVIQPIVIEDEEDDDLWTTIGHAQERGAKAPSPSSIDEEIESYKELTLPAHKMSQLQFWKTYATTLPQLSSFAFKMLSIQASEAESERLFSAASRALGPARACLSPSISNC